MAECQAQVRSDIINHGQALRQIKFIDGEVVDNMLRRGWPGVGGGPQSMNPRPPRDLELLKTGDSRLLLGGRLDWLSQG
jgi:hypothetical protein